MGQPAVTIQQYIDQHKDLAIKEMKRTGVPASIKLAHGWTKSVSAKVQ
jgi:hypothetical protein